MKQQTHRGCRGNSPDCNRIDRLCRSGGDFCEAKIIPCGFSAREIRRIERKKPSGGYAGGMQYPPACCHGPVRRMAANRARNEPDGPPPMAGARAALSGKGILQKRKSSCRVFGGRREKRSTEKEGFFVFSASLFAAFQGTLGGNAVFSGILGKGFCGFFHGHDHVAGIVAG